MAQVPPSQEDSLAGPSTDGTDRLRIGPRLRRAREAADSSGISTSFLSRVERGLTAPPVASLMQICNTLGLSISELSEEPEAILTCRKDRLGATDSLNPRAVVHALVTPAYERQITVVETISGSRGSSGEMLGTLGGECAVCVILDGAVEVQVEDERFTLEAGDALTYGAAALHSSRALSNGVRILCIVAPGLPDPIRVTRGEVPDTPASAT